MAPMYVQQPRKKTSKFPKFPEKDSTQLLGFIYFLSVCSSGKFNDVPFQTCWYHVSVKVRGKFTMCHRAVEDRSISTSCREMEPNSCGSHFAMVPLSTKLWWGNFPIKVCNIQCKSIGFHVANPHK